MTKSMDAIFCTLLRIALGLTSDFPYSPTEFEWRELFKMAERQTVLGVFYDAISRLPKESRPPRLLVLRRAVYVETIRNQNRLMNQDAARYTRLFAEHSFRSVILKGQANARLYPDPLSRQAGDIDIWVPVGYYKVKQLLLDTGLVAKDDSTYKVLPHVRHLGFRNENGIEIEVHHRPTEIPFRNKEFQAYLLAELDNSTFAPEGFYSPSIRFALVMQLQHLYYHCIREGVGLRHFMDYFMLLKHSTEADREIVWSKVKRFGLAHACAAVMWVLREVFGLSEGQMLCSPDRRRGMRLYRETFTGGNFGRGKNAGAGAGGETSLAGMRRGSWLGLRRSPLARRISFRLQALSWFTFDPLNTVLREIHYWRDTISLIPERIRRREMFLK